MMSLKSAAKALTPRPLLRAIRKRKLKQQMEGYEGLDPREVFTKIYKEGAWKTPDQASMAFSSGTGSHRPEIVETYVAAVSDFLHGLGHKPNVVDLGCGDFHVGARIRPLCGHYTACDIVQPLVEFNRTKFAELDVDFRLLDLIQDPLPPAEVAFLRQVLQHLSNEQIAKALPKLAVNYKYLVLSEHLPLNDEFTPNIDKPAGPHIRLAFGSGVVLTRPPFNLAPIEEREICRVEEYSGLITTTVYRL